MHQYNVGVRFERIAFDITGAFPESEREHRYLLIAMDYFTTWPDVYVIPQPRGNDIGRRHMTKF
jgi:hypothetical protein